jgi:hypothetical protein
LFFKKFLTIKNFNINSFVSHSKTQNYQYKFKWVGQNILLSNVFNMNHRTNYCLNHNDEAAFIFHLTFPNQPANEAA